MPGTPDSNAPETIIAFDFGLRRIGVAVGQDITASANPIDAVRNGATGPDWPAIERTVREWRPQRLIVGMPLHEDGAPPDLAEPIERFITELERFGLPVERVDERYSSIEAGEQLRAERASGLRGKISKEAIDSMAAALIAQRWLQRSP